MQSSSQRIVDPAVTTPPDSKGEFGCAGGERGDQEMSEAVEAIAELALLGMGNAATMYPNTLDEAYAAYGSDEMEWRVVL